MILVRMPQIVLKGRFWAEEGRVFFAIGRSKPALDVLLTSYGGYLNLVANLGGVLSARMVPYAYAPYVTILLGLCLQLCPAILLLTSSTPWLNRRVVVAGALLLLVAVPGSEEVWLTTIEAQVHLSICVALILAMQPADGATGAFQLCLLALAGLSGPGAWLLAPLFALRAILDRSRKRTVQAAIFATAVLLQALFFCQADPGRTLAIHPVLFLDLAFDKHVMLAFLGPDVMADTASALTRLVYLMHPPLWPAEAMLGFAALLALAVLRHPSSEPFWLLAAAAVMIAVSDIGALRPFAALFPSHSASRYAYAPQVLINLSLLGLAATRRGPTGWLATAAAGWLLAIGLIYYQDPAAKAEADGPSWRVELAAHRADPSHRVRIWPDRWHALFPDDRAPIDGP